MRSRYATINTIFGLANQVALAVINLIIRRVMARTIGIDYLGVNGLFSNIITLLSLAESGFGIAIVYSLYKPIAENNQEEISKLVNYFSVIYRRIASIIFLFGIACIPLLKYLVKDNPFSSKDTIFFFLMFLLNNCVSYLFAYKASLLQACQRQYIVNIVSICVNLFFAVFRVIALVVERNYIYFLILVIINTLFVNIGVALICNHKYTFLIKNKKLALEKEKRKHIWGDVKALMWHKVGGYVLNGTDNIVISGFVGLATVGLYSNYLAISTLINSVFTQFLNAITPAMGDIIVEDSRQHTNKSYETYRIIHYLSFIMYSIGTMFILTVCQTFIGEVWLGREYMLSLSVVVLVAVNFYLSGMRLPATAVKSAAGIYKQDQFSPVCESIINLIVSIILVKRLGVAGVLLGTIIALICMPFWTAPFFIYRDLFHERFSIYLRDSLRFLFFTIVGSVVSCLIVNRIVIGGLAGFLIKAVVQGAIAIVYALLVTLISPEKKGVIEWVNKVLHSRGKTHTRTEK